MIIQDHVLKIYLKNVYFITGTPCGGKTTVSRALAKRHGIPVYDIDEQFSRHQTMADLRWQPAMTKSFQNADAFFGRSVEEYAQWLIDNTREQLDFVLLDLICLSKDQTVLCDCHLTVEEADRLTDRSRVAFLIRDPSDLVEEYCNRPDHQGFRDFLSSSTDVERAAQTCDGALRKINVPRYHEIKNSPYFWVERNADSTIEETIRQVEQHFGWRR